MHIYVAIGRSQSNVSTTRGKLDLDPRAQADVVLHQVLIHLLLVVKLCGPWSEIHADPDAKLGPLPFLINGGYSLARTVNGTGFASLHHG